MFKSFSGNTLLFQFPLKRELVLPNVGHLVTANSVFCRLVYFDIIFTAVFKNSCF